MLRKNLKPLYLAGMIDLCLLATPAYAQDTTQRLVSQGNYWHDQGRDDLAADTWKKLLSIDPNQPDALLGLGQIDLAQGRPADARKRMQQLQAKHPDSPQLQRLRIAVGGGQSGGNSNLAAARRAAAAGRSVEAVRAYEASFEGGAPPPNLALEYYQSLAGTPQGWEKARDGLRKLHAAEPDNTAAALALAQVLTYREPTRREGIAQLRELARRPDVGGPARNGWRQALLWLGAGSADVPLYQAFLAEMPNDAEVAAKLAQVREQRNAPGSDPNGVLLGEAFNALNAGNLAAAEQRFTQVLRARPRDPEALGGLGSVRLRQQRFSEAQELLRPAAAANGKWKSAYDSARYWQLLQQSAAAGKRGAASEAAALAQQAQQIDPRQPAAYVALGDLQSDAGAAEQSYRKALALDGNDVGALQGLVGLYSRQGRIQEATELFNRLPAAQREKSGGEAMLRSNVQRARARQALEAGDAVAAQTELESAMVERPGDPWIRLDLARLYQQLGRPDQARSVMDGLLALHGDLPEAQYANALLAQAGGDWQSAYASLEHIPPAQRTPEMAQLRDVAWLELQARQAKNLQAQGRSAEAQALLARTETALGDQANQPPLLASLAGAWADAGNPQRALVLAQRLIAGGNAGTEERLQYAGVLLRAHQDAELSAILRQLQGQTLTPEQLRRYRALRTGYALRQVDALRELGNLEAAYDALSPVLAEQPQDREALGALARLYAAAGDQRQAQVIYRQILQSSPNDLDVLVAAANSAAAQSDLDNAEAYLQRALALAPDSPDVLAAAGRVYRSAGKKRKAEQYFRAALAAQQRQAGQLDNGLPGARGTTAYAAAGRPFNPFAGMTGPMRSTRAVLSDTQPAAAYPLTAAVAPAPAYTGGGDDGGLPPPVASNTPALAPLPVPGQRPATVAAVPMQQAAPATLPTLQVTAARLPLPAPGSGNTVLDELREVQADNSNELTASASFRSRDGEAGLGRLDEIQTPLHGEFAVGEGKLGVDVVPTLVDAGDVGSDYAITSRFGAGPTIALDDALAADRDLIDDYVSTSLYQLLLTEGNTSASQTLFYRYAVSTGLYSELYTTYGSDTATRAAVYAQPLFAYLLSINASTTTISTIAAAILNNTALSEDLSSADMAALKALAASTAATSMTPTQLSDALYTMAAAGSASRRLGQDASGVGLSVSYRNGGLRADIGSTPLGFPEQRVVGGVGYKGELGEHLSYDAQLQRRAVTDSVLSFAGARDPRGNLQWGGVTSNGARISATLDNGLLGGYVNLAQARLVGDNVQDNTHRQADLGVYVHALETANQSLTAGLNLTAMRYDRNLAGFTYGQGGYFSPQSYFDVGFPVHWSGRSSSQKVNWKVDASVGVQHFRTDDSAYFPTNAEMQQAAYQAASLASLLGLSSVYTEPVYKGASKTGVSYNLSGAAEWQVAPQLFLGGRLTLNNARDYQQFNANVYVRFVLDRLGAALGRAPQVPASPYASGY